MIITPIVRPIIRGDTEAPWHPSALLDGYEGFYADFSTMDGIVRDGDTWMLGEHIFTGRRSPQLVSGGIAFDSSIGQLLEGADRLAPIMGRYPITIAMNIASVASGQINTGVIAHQSAFYILGCEGSKGYVATRNPSYVESSAQGSGGGVILGDYRADRTGVYYNGALPSYHTSQPALNDIATEISIGGLSDGSPTYGTGVLKSVFMVNRSLTDEERQKLLDYM